MTRSASFRDPAGFVDIRGDRVFRVVNREAAQTLRDFLAGDAARKLTAAGSLVRTVELEASDSSVRFEHDPVPFVSYPFEWSAEMLHAAALLTLSLCRALLEEGYGLKDATPFNVLFRGSKAVFVDLLSIERRRPRDPIWRPAAQFERTFILPLIAYRYFGMKPAMIFLKSREGLEPDELYGPLGVLRRLRPRFLLNITLPVLFGRSKRTSEPKLYEPASARTEESARFSLRATFNRLERQVEALRPDVVKSSWTTYEEEGPSYSASAAQTKREFVTAVLRRHSPRWVFDIGSNTGAFSRLAVAEGASVVAIDRDAAALGKLWRSASADSLDILPLVVDIARPTPPTGWENAETLSFVERVQGRFDMVLVLALIHHLMLSELIPLARIVDFIAALRARVVVVEYIGPEDPMFKRLVRGRGDLDLVSSYNQEMFESEFGRRFQLASSQQTEQHRYVYEMTQR